MAKKGFSLKYKLREGDNYENLASRFGTAVLGNAGIYGDEDLKKDQEYNFNVDTREEAELIQKKDLDYQRKNNAAIRQNNAKNFDEFWNEHGQNILTRYGYDRGKDQQYANDLKESLRSQYIQGVNSVEDLYARADKRVKEFWNGTYADKKRQEELQKKQHNLEEIQKQWNSLRYVKGNSLTNPGRFQFSYNANLYDLSTPQTNVKYQEQVEKELGRKLTDQERQYLGRHAEDYQNFVKLGKGKTYQDYLKYLEGEHKSAESTRNLTRDIATGITLSAAGVSSIPGSFLRPMITGTAADIATRKGMDAAGMDKNSYVYKTLPILTSTFAGGITKAVPEYFALKEAVKTAPKYAQHLIKKGVSNSAQHADSLKGVLGQEALNAGLSSLPAVPISLGLQNLGVNEVASDMIGMGLGGLWGGANASNASRAYHFTTGSGGQIGLKNVVKNYLANGMQGKEYESLSTGAKTLLGAKQLGKGFINTVLPVRNWGHGGYSGVYESDLGATASRAGDMVKRAPKGVTGAVDAAYNLDVTPTGTYNMGSYMGGQDKTSLSLMQQLHQALEPVYDKRVGGNKLMTMFSNMPEEESVKILKGMTVDVDGVATPLVKDGAIDSKALQKALYYNADVKTPYMKGSDGTYKSYKGDRYVENATGEKTKVRKFLGKQYVKEGPLKYRKVNTDVTSDESVPVFGLREDGTFAPLKSYNSVKGTKGIATPKTGSGVPFTGHGNNTTVGDAYITINNKGIPTTKALAQDIRGHMDIKGRYNDQDIVISLDPYATGSGGGNPLGRLFAGFLDKNMKQTPITVNFNTGVSKYGNSNATKVFMPFSTQPTSVKGATDDYYRALKAMKEQPIKEGNKSITRTIGDNKMSYTLKEDAKLREYKRIIDDLTKHKNGGIIGLQMYGL